MNHLSDKLFIKSQEIAKSVLENQDEFFSSRDVITGLFGGSPGIILFLFYYGKYSNNSTYKEAGEEMLYKTFNVINSSNDVLNFNFAYGIIGLYAVLFHISGIGLIAGDNIDYDYELDDIVDSKIQQNMELGNYEFFTGVCGYLLFLTFQARYFKKSHSVIKEKIGEICAAICHIMESNHKCGPAWNRNKEHVVLSIPHGACGWLSLLCKLKELNLDSEHSSKLLEYISSYLLPFVTREEKFSYFPAQYNDICNYSNNDQSRLGWCYGDLGCCLPLLRYATITRDDNLRDTLLDMLKRTSIRRDLQQNMVNCAGLCHGSSGIAHIFDLLYHNYGIDTFRETADYWYIKTLEFGESDSGYAGYRNVRIWNGEPIYTDDLSLLGGISGIGLSMISRLSGDHTWDEFFLIDIT